MVHCSKCQSEIHEDFGVVTCSACGATLIVDLDGEVRDFEQIESVESPPELEQVNTIEDFTESGSFAGGLDVPVSSVVSEDLDQISNQGIESSGAEILTSANYSLGELQSQEGSTEELPEVDSEFEIQSAFEMHSEFEVESVLSANSNSEPDSEPDSESELDAEPGFGSAIEEFDEWAETVGEEPDISASVSAQNGEDGESSTDNVLLEIKDFGNSEVSSAEDGQFLYTLRLDGIDSGDVRAHILQVLQDPRLKMDAERILAESKSGHLSIRKLNAVKAFVIVNAIKSLPIDIFWEQHDITS